MVLDVAARDDVIEAHVNHGESVGLMVRVTLLYHFNAARKVGAYAKAERAHFSPCIDGI